MKLTCHKNFCSFSKEMLSKRARESHVFYLVRGRAYDRVGYPPGEHWWWECTSHVKKTPEAILKAAFGSCMKKRHAEIYKMDLKNRTVERIFEGVIQ